MNSKQRLRTRYVFALIIIGAVFLAGSLYYTEIIKGHSYAQKAQRQYVRPDVASFDRGTIYFQTKDGTRLAAATLGRGSVIFMNPSLLTDASQAYGALKQYLPLNQNDFMAKAAKAKSHYEVVADKAPNNIAEAIVSMQLATNDHYEIVADQVQDDKAQAVRNIQLPGLYISPESWRTYPGGSMAAQVIGLTGENASSSSVTGRYGLEKYYESVLSRPGVSSSANIFAQLFGGLNTVFGSNDSTEGDVITSIDPTTQKYLEKILNDTEKIWHASEIGGIIIDPSTGEIVAMASLPTYDPNNTANVKDVGVFSDPLVEHIDEMGSIMKPLTMATALETGVEKPGSTYDDTGTMTLNGKKISNFDGQARGVIPMQQILSQSLNIGAATIALKAEHDIGPGTLYKYFTSFGLGQKTGIDEPNEATGIMGNLKPSSNTRDVNIATAAYGQGIAVSPVNMVQALSVLANGGYVVTPHLAKSIEYGNGTTKIIDFPKKGPVLSKQTVADVTTMLVKVVDGTIAKAHPDIYTPNYSVAAKTGTAQIPDPVNGGYYPDRYLHSFFGYFPAYNPKFLVFLYQVYPKGAEYASATLTDPFSQLTKFLISYYNIAPDR